jgi:hypothetical protein
MSESEELEKKLNDEREKVRLNSIKMLNLLGYDKDTSKLTQEQVDARIELMMEQKQNETKDPKTPTPVLFKPIDEERENKEAVSKSNTRVLEFEELTGKYDALTAQIPQLRCNEQCGHYEGLARRNEIRILRLPASIKLDDNHSIIRRVVL